MSPGLIEPADRAPLLKHRDAEIARAAQKLFGHRASQSRAQVVAEYLPAVRQKGDAVAGAKVFERECKTCHRIGDRGFALGPDLTGSPSGDPTALLSNILDPNASVSPNNVQYVMIDQSGRTYSGIIVAETATSLTLRRGEGAQDTILRGQVAEIISTGLSLMPEGFEKKNLEARDGGPDRFSACRFTAVEMMAISSPTEDHVRWTSELCPGLIEPDE